MKDVMEYKGYVGSVRYSAEDHVLYGRLEGIRDLVAYEATDVESLKNSFHEAVDEYIADCQAEGREPDQPFKGTFNIRPGRELHKRLAVLAGRKEKTLNAIVVEALEFYLAAVDVDRSASATRLTWSVKGTTVHVADFKGNDPLAAHWTLSPPGEAYIVPADRFAGRPQRYVTPRLDEEFSKPLNEQFCGAS